MIKDIIENGEDRDDRTGVGTISKFGTQTRWSLEDDNFPLLTTKRVFWKGVAEELFWFIKGDTNALHLKEKGYLVPRILMLQVLKFGMEIVLGNISTKLVSPTVKLEIWVQCTDSNGDILVLLTTQCKATTLEKELTNCNKSSK